MARPKEFENLRRVKISIEEKLHVDAVNYARDLSLADGFSGLVARLLIRQMKTKGKHVGTFPRRYVPAAKR